MSYYNEFSHESWYDWHASTCYTSYVGYDSFTATSRDHEIWYDWHSSTSYSPPVRYDLFNSARRSQTVRYDLFSPTSRNQAVRYDLLSPTSRSPTSWSDWSSPTPGCDWSSPRSRRVRYDLFNNNDRDLHFMCNSGDQTSRACVRRVDYKKLYRNLYIVFRHLMHAVRNIIKYLRFYYSGHLYVRMLYKMFCKHKFIC